ncbi:helix-turn-helix domain-containing protein [Clostridium algoriphilum]|uniref:CdaR family transcriptional regulator n=1 Tax=Clostridium algoriphilum TaxID=198347 RepID=UPI001CF5DF15|nr:sugar diacid recognition domain-containing protein [Clostridium algoriphilum]MCB2294103.1 helix-turn-helix domain-containing protein [Clostridium algoriphilum]
MKLSKNIAQKIVSEMMNVIPYNINVMDENGVIIGSGDINRIGNVHEGAIKAINNAFINEVYENSARIKPGVNEPIIINNKVIGVVGITGNPNEVSRFSKLVRVTAVLLIEESKTIEEIQNKRLTMLKFYNDVAHRKTTYDDAFRQKAKNYGLDLTKKCQAILVYNNNDNISEYKILREKYTHYYNLSDSKTVFFVTDNLKSSEVLRDIEKSGSVRKISLGGEEEIAAISLENAALAMNLGIKIKPSSLIYNYSDLKFFINLSCNKKESLISLFTNLDKTGKKLELIRTIQIYVEQNGDINKVASSLNIHRNTLNYRLDRIKQLTGKNPKILLELFELLCGLMWI